MKRIACVAGVVLCGSGLAMAGCPSHVADLPGVKLVRSTPYVVNIYRQTPEGLTQVAAPDTEAAADAILSLYPHPLVAGRETGPYSDIAFDYAVDPAGLDALTRTGVWQSPAAFLLNGRKIGDVVFERRLLGTEMLTIGDCTTEVWLVEARMEMEQGDGSWDILSYAPALGLVLRSVTMSAEGEPLHEFAYDRIEALSE